MEPKKRAQVWIACGFCKSRGRHRKRLHGKALYHREISHGRVEGPIIVCKKCSGTGLIHRRHDTALYRSAPSPISIGVIGAGIGGLAFAAACQHRNMDVTVFERDKHFDDRSQGYGLTMQQAAPQLAALGITHLEKGVTSVKHVVHDQNGTVKGQWGMAVWSPHKFESAETQWNKTQIKKRQNVHIPRQELRFELYRQATVRSEDVVQWDHKLTNFSESEDGVNLEFELSNGEKVHKTVDLLVGADGLRSVVREKLVPDSPLRFLNCIVILGICRTSRVLSDLEDNQQYAKDLLNGTTVFQTADGNTRMYMMPFTGANEYMWQLSFPCDEETARSYAAGGATRLLQEAKARCQSWHAPIPEILFYTPLDKVTGYPVYDRDILQPEQLTSKRVTLIGDAAHPMSPFKGQGANQSLLDALSLVRLIYYRMFPLHAPSNLDALYRKDVHKFSRNVDLALLDNVLRTYEAEMLPRTATKVQASAEAAKFLHTEIAIREGNITRGKANALANEDDIAKNPFNAIL